MRRKFFDNVEPTDWRDAWISGVVVGLLLVFGIGAFALTPDVRNVPTALSMFGLFLILAGAMFSVFTAAITLFFSVLIR